MGAPAISAVGATGSSSLRARSVSHRRLKEQSDSSTTHLDTRLPQQRPLEVRQASGKFITDAGFAMLGPSRCLCAACGSRRAAVGTSASNGCGLRTSQRALAGVAVVTDATGVGCCFPGGGRGAGDWVSGRGFCDASGLGFLACEAVHEAGLCGGGGGTCAGHGCVCRMYCGMESFLVVLCCEFA